MLWHRWQLLLGTAALVLSLTLNLTDNARTDAIANQKRNGIIAPKPHLVQRQQRTALIIGNANYKSADALANPLNDATDIANSLRQLGFDVTLLKDADLRQMEEALETFNRNLRQGGVGLFYYAGHGVQVDGENYLIPVNARLEREQDVRYEGLPMGKILNVMEDAANDVNIIVLDACRNNPFTRKWRSLQRGLAAPIQAVKGTLIAYATAPGKLAFDGDGRNSPYTTALLTHMKTPGLDVEQMFKAVRTDVLKTTRGRQTPWESSSLVGSFAFNPANNSRDNTIVSTPPSPRTQPPATTPSPTSSPRITPLTIKPLPIPSLTLKSPSIPSPRITSTVTTPTPTSSPSASSRRISFVQQPRLVEVASSFNQVNVSGATYYFTIQLPEAAGTTLQKITINQREGADHIHFQLDKSSAFVGTRSQKGEKLNLQDITKDEKNRTISIIFEQPVTPGKVITIALRPLQNPQRDGVYLFGVTAFPTGDLSKGQFLGFGRLQFYQNI